MVPGFDRESSEAAIRMAADDAAITAAAGVHPYAAAELDLAAKDRLTQIWTGGGASAVGEIGLDFAGRGYPDEDVQAECFAWQLNQAECFSLPVIVHQRESAAAIFDQLSGRRLDGVMHCWSLGPEELDRFLGLGMYISFAGLLTYRSAETVRAAAARVPDDRLLVETDAPYLVPRGSRKGRRNEPANLPRTVSLLAQLRESAPQEIESVSTANAGTLFNLATSA